jgi:thioesterase domain-containing protein
MGGVVAYEMARQLLAQGQQVEMLALVDSSVPADGERTWVDDEVAVLSSFAYDLGLSLDGLTLTREEVGRLPEEERLSLVLEECKRAGVLSQDVELPQVARLLRIFKANAHALQRYRPQPSDCPITLLAAEERLSPDHDVSAGWGSLSGRVEVYQVPGNHYTIVREPHVRELAQHLDACLERSVQLV